MKNFTLFLVIIAAVLLIAYAWTNYTTETAIINGSILAFVLYKMKKAPLIPADVDTD